MSVHNRNICKYADKMRLKGSGNEIQIVGCVKTATHREVENPDMIYCKEHAEIISQDNIDIEEIPN